ncbi:MAG TPA: diguanylate cyclase [Solirubrobacteraceae bacterium]|nr:diguanylate cyclase [Solirubrobacteraceae bacterium]
MTDLRSGILRPFHMRGRWLLAAIPLTFLVTAAVGVVVTLTLSARAKDRAAVVQVAARQRMLAERYLNELLLVKAGQQADPQTIGADLNESAHALLEGGTVPAVKGDDDDATVAAATGTVLRRQLEEQIKLIADLRGSGQALLTGGRPPEPTGGETLPAGNPLMRARILVALTSATALNAARTVAARADDSVQRLLDAEIALSIGGLIVSLLLAGLLILILSRQTAHFRALAKSSTDLVAVIDPHGCRYVSDSLAAKAGRPAPQLLGDGLLALVGEQDRELLGTVARTGTPSSFIFTLVDAGGEERTLEAHVTDLRGERHLRGVVLNARDITERVRLEAELREKARRDGFATQLAEALEMADEELDVCEVVEHAMGDVSEATPMELLLSDSSRASLRRVASNDGVEPPGCPVRSPFSCVAVRRGSAVTFESSEDLNACPHLRGRPSGACSAVCVPVSFMGRSLGVLHTTGPDGEAPGAERVERLRTLAAQAGARIGTVRAFQKTQLQASTDSLTGLINRRSAEEQMRGLLRARRPFALALGDLDHFKQLNDTHGHEAGDRALRLFADVARRSIRDLDTIARWGGEEFVVLLPDLDRFGAIEVLERMRAALARAHPGETPRFTVSFGVSDTQQAQSASLLFRVADEGLYAAKLAGRDRVSIGTIPDEESQGPRRLDVELPSDEEEEFEPLTGGGQQDNGAPLNSGSEGPEEANGTRAGAASATVKRARRTPGAKRPRA